ncbi:MAG TPA: hypothetical protein PKL57_07335, partial [Candidatus Wallbacteria bacterium]|nr:hypothetical protein [Candidatus Wallbacteria bacterium]
MLNKFKNLLKYILLICVLLNSSVSYASQKSDAAKIEKLEKQVLELTESLKALSGEMQKLKKENNSNVETFKTPPGEEDEISAIRSRARAAAATKKTATSSASSSVSSKIFKGGERAQQAINPEISVTFDHLSSYKLNSPHNYAGMQSGENFRMAGIHMQSEMDPYSFGKLTFAAREGAFEMGEAYAIFSNLIPGATVTAGKFRSQFGVINRWHLPALDSCLHPISLATILGPGGLAGKGFSIDYNLKKPWSDANQITLQLQRADNAYLFSGANSGHIPSVLLHVKNYYDLSRDKYFELGLSGMIGPNSRFGITNPAGESFDEAKRFTRLAGIDLTYFYEPLNQAKYRNFLWRAELYHANKEILNPARG